MRDLIDFIRCIFPPVCFIVCSLVFCLCVIRFVVIPLEVKNFNSMAGTSYTAKQWFWNSESIEHGLFETSTIKVDVRR